jgi:hypothetical protein
MRKKSFLGLCLFFACAQGMDSSSSQSEDAPVYQVPKAPNHALILAMINPPIKLSYVKFLFMYGADPNFRPHTLEITPLMRAVCMNHYPFVKLLLKKGAKWNDRDADDRLVRSLNLIYFSKKINPIMNAIVARMLEIDEYNELNPNNTLDYRYELDQLEQSKIIREALMIDLMFEEKRAPSGIADDKNALLKILKDPRANRALSSYVCFNHLANIPANVRYALLNPF